MIEARVHPTVLYYLEGRREVAALRQPIGLHIFTTASRDYGNLRVVCDADEPLPESMDAELDRLVGLM